MNTPNYLVATSLLMLAAVTSSLPSDPRFAHNQIGPANLDTDAFSMTPTTGPALLAHESHPDPDPERHAHHPHPFKPIHG
jgi:hypothetical protein